MININNAILDKLITHKVGNSYYNEGIIHSSDTANINEELATILSHYFLNPFAKVDSFCHFFHESDINLNEVYVYVSAILDNPDNLHEQSVNISKHLYAHSDHPKIKGGELYVVYFDNCYLDGEEIDAVGIFKSENRDTFLKVYTTDANVALESEKGININKLDKGCLIFNTDRENGYKVLVIDNTNKGAEAHYWIDEFLHVKQRRDEYYQTENTISAYKDFIVKELPNKFNVSKADQAELLNRSVDYFKTNEEFVSQEFEQSVIGRQDVIDSFNDYRSEYQKNNDINISDNFAISNAAVKKQSRKLKSVIKLDKNFHIYIHGYNAQIKKGFDEQTGMNYYQLFFDEES